MAGNSSKVCWLEDKVAVRRRGKSSQSRWDWLSLAEWADTLDRGGKK